MAKAARKQQAEERKAEAKERRAQDAARREARVGEKKQREAARKEVRDSEKKKREAAKNEQIRKKQAAAEKREEREERRRAAAESKKKAEAKRAAKAEEKARAASAAAAEKDRRRQEKAQAAAAKRQRRSGESYEESPGRKRGKRETEYVYVEAPKKKSHLFRNFIVLILLLIAILLGGLYAGVGYVYSKMHYNEIASVKSESPYEGGVINVLMIGNDSRTGDDDGRSDAMILVSMSSVTHEILFTSVLRDVYVDIPGHGKNRLNAAYSYGGPELLMETIEQNFGIKVNRYVSVNFEAFATLVDAVGGVDLNLTNEEVQWVNAYLNEYNMLRGVDMTTDYMDTSASGWLHLNGAQALAYSRIRYIGTDFERTNRQRKVINDVIDKLPNAMMTNGPQVIENVCSELTTNMTQNECYFLVLQAWKFKLYGRDSGSIPLEGTWSDYTTDSGMMVLKIDFDANKQYLQEKLYIKK